MAEVSCPFCGKKNPPGQEACLFCGTTLPAQSPLFPSAGREGPSGPEDNQAAAPADDLPDWLRGLRPAASEPEANMTDSDSADLPDWLTSPGSPGQPEPGPTLSGDLPAWLRSSAPAGESAEPAAPPAGPTPAGGAEAEGSEPEWLQRIRHRKSEETPAPPEPGPQFPPMPEWLAGLSATESSSPPTPPAGSTPPASSAGAEPGSLPDWLEELKAPAEARPQSDSLPDWLAEGSPTGSASNEIVPAPKFEEEDLSAGQHPNLLSWLESESSPPSPVEESEPAAIPGELPDWLSGLGGPPAALPAETGPEIAAGEGAEIDWLKSFQEGAGDEASASLAELPAEIGPAASFAPEELTRPHAPQLPSGPSDESNVPAFAFEDEEPAGLEPGELPDWLLKATSLKGLSGNQPAGLKTPAFQTPSESGLAPAELPSWVEAMRPVEPAAGNQPGWADSGEVESAGPLSGLRAVLPAEPLLTETQKPPSYSVKLQVSEAQAAQAEMLAEMLKSQGEGRVLPTQAPLPSQPVLRWLIALALFLAILWPTIFTSLQSPLPAASQETAILSQQIEALPGGAPVLVAVDYEPGISGEMEPLASAVLDHLMLKGAYLALVSTVPTGPVQAERLVARTMSAGNHHYSAPDQYANLGFLPGGQAGLQGLAQAPRQALPSLQKLGALSLQNIQSIGDFAMVMVITENAETARAWIEQVGSRLNGAPLIMVVSAQADPLVQPYYDPQSGPVKGLLAGLAGGAAYEHLTGRQSFSSLAWTPFSMGLAAAVVLIVLGGLTSAIGAWLAPRRKRGKGEQG